MSKGIWTILIVLITIFAVYAISNARREHPTHEVVGQEMKEAAQATGNYVEDTGKKIKEDLSR